MEIEFWHERWKHGQIGFHQDKAHPMLTKSFNSLNLKKNTPVFVPLCGKSLDMFWLKDQGYTVIGNEISPIASEAFFIENNLAYKSETLFGFNTYVGQHTQIICGDFFDLQPEMVTQAQAIFDRASLIALPPEMRLTYTAKLFSLFAQARPIFLITLEYPQHEMQGPPFSVSQDELVDLYSQQYTIKKLHSEDILVNEPRFRSKGLSSLIEHTYLLTPNGDQS